MTPALLALVKVAPEKPENATALRTPGVLLTISVARWMTASVRSSDDPSGSCTTMIAYPWSMLGMNPRGTVCTMKIVA